MYVVVNMLSNSSSTSTDQLDFFCFNLKNKLDMSIGVIAVKNILVLPLSAFVLYLGHHRWRRHRSFKTVSHSEIITYHLAVNEMFWGVGTICFLYGSFCENIVIMILGMFWLSSTFFGEVLFHTLTCVDRYLAVVQPVSYLMFRNTRGVQIRNISIGCAWLMCLGLACSNVDVSGIPVINSMLSVLVVSVIILTFCSVSVLCVLIGPGPGGGVREKVDQTKLRAFYTITIITSVLWVWFAGLIVTTALVTSLVLSKHVSCVLIASVSWFNLPTSLVSPLLYLHRAGKLACGRPKSEPRGQLE